MKYKSDQILSEIIDEFHKEYYGKIEEEIKKLILCGHKLEDLTFVIIKYGFDIPEWLEDKALRQFDAYTEIDGIKKLFVRRFICNKKDIPNE